MDSIKEKGKIKKGHRTILKNGFIVDGTGKKGFVGDIIINGKSIEKISEKNIEGYEEVIDCSGKVIAPGFIDAHSHNDWFITSDNPNEFINPFISQGITTFIGGNCGYGISGFKKNTKHKDRIEDNLFKAGHNGIHWETQQEYFDYVEDKGISNNIAVLVGHGTTRTSMRGFNPNPLDDNEMKELLYLLEEAMDQGAKGVSLGLQYEPGIFSNLEELKEVAKLVKRKNKIMTIHLKAYSKLSTAYPIKPMGKAHNIIALEEMIKLAEETGLKLQLSHLIFVGKKTWSTYHQALKIIEKSISRGIDIKFDTYAYNCGASVITVILPEWFLAKVPQSYTNKSDLLRLKIEMFTITKLLGFGLNDIQLTYANHSELNRYNGMFLSQIAKERGLSDFDNYIDIVKKSGGSARVIMYKYSNQKIIEELIKHPASLYMTDAWIETTGVQNPAAFGGFPRILEIVRNNSLISLEEAIHKMTGATADRFSIKDRGLIREGLPADITIFDWSNIKDNTTATETSNPPTGIEHVFINGNHIKDIRNNNIKRHNNSGTIIK